MKNLKRIYRKFNKHFLIIFIKMINPFFDKIGVYLHPKFSELKQYNLSYAKKTKGNAPNILTQKKLLD